MATAEPVLRLLLPRASPPAIARLGRELAGALRAPGRLDIPLGDRAPEEILAVCLRCGVTARGSRIVGRGASG